MRRAVNLNNHRPTFGEKFSRRLSACVIILLLALALVEVLR